MITHQKAGQYYSLDITVFKATPAAVSRLLKSAGRIIIVGTILFYAAGLNAYELESRYATIIYSSEQELRTFDSALDMGPALPKGSGTDTLAQRVTGKVDHVVQKVMSALDMHPAGFRFSMVIQPNVRDVQNHYRKLYKKSAAYTAFYSPSQNRVFIPAESAGIRVLAHEVGHAVVENHFSTSPPLRVHEALAQFAEEHVIQRH